MHNLAFQGSVVPDQPAHVHFFANTVSPETGQCLSLSTNVASFKAGIYFLSVQIIYI